MPAPACQPQVVVGVHKNLHVQAAAQQLHVQHQDALRYCHSDPKNPKLTRSIPVLLADCAWMADNRLYEKCQPPVCSAVPEESENALHIANCAWKGLKADSRLQMLCRPLCDVKPH